MLRIDAQEPSDKLIEALLEYQQAKLAHLSKLQNYYEGRHEILDRTNTDRNKPNNLIVNNFPSYITDVAVGYFIGKPVAYYSQDDIALEVIQDIMNYNDEANNNMELVKIASVKGSAYEVLFTSENDEGDVIPRFGVVEPENMLVAYDTTLTPEPSFAMRVYETVDIVEDETTVHIDFYTESKMYHYLLGGKGEIRLEGVEEHYFGSVPVVEYINNDERIGDFERVLTLIDAYDKAQSDTANDHEYFSDAYLKIVNFSGTNAQDINAMKKDRVIMVDADGDIEWVTKQINDTAIENYKDRLQQDLHTVSKVPRLTDESFAGSASGVALEFKMWGLEQNAAQKERKFKKGLQRRLELICNFLKVKGQDYDYRDYKLVFTRNMPTNLVEIVDTVVKLKGIISDQTAIAQLPFIEDVNDELEMIEREQEGRVNLDIEQDIENTEDLEDDSDERESGIDT